MAGFQLEPDFEDRPAELPDVLCSFAGGSFWIADQVRRLDEDTRREIGKGVCGVKSDAGNMPRAE